MSIIAGRECTVELQPSADMCWQSWANNETTQAATYPSPYANVHKGKRCDYSYIPGICVKFTHSEVLELEENCKLYFNLLCLFFLSHVNVTSWRLGYALPYHALKLYDMYHVGYGIISQQGKEAKHSAVKNDLKLSNRSNRTDKSGKRWQVMRTNYVRNVYLPEHQPLPQTYKSHFKS